MDTLKVVELFAGVGGFRLGLEGLSRKDQKHYKVIWSNQWEPSTKTQHASDVYVRQFGDKGHSKVNISNVSIKDIPDHDLLVGGFPCQDYSVARTLNKAEGIIGKKGVLWWEIHRLLKELGRKKPAYLMLENVDRLLKSPAPHRGRDFAIMLASLSDLGYIIEWRVINAADYGMPQRRRRVFILGYRKGSRVFNKCSRNDPIDWIEKDGVIAKAFPVTIEMKLEHIGFDIQGDLAEITEEFDKYSQKVSPFYNSGIMVNRKVYTIKSSPEYKGKRTRLADILLKDDEVEESFFVNEKDLEKWKYLKGAKKETRKSNTGYEYFYSEGSMTFPEPLDRPSRTIVTGEGGPTPSRFKHIILTRSGRYRRLTPIELERLNMFPRNHTQGQTAAKRAFFMGNALVVGVVKRLGEQLYKLHSG